MKLRIVSIGRDRSGLFEAGVREYAGRLERYCHLELLELAEARKEQGIDQAIVDEGQRILDRLRPGECCVALDERGKPFTSEQLANWLGKQRDAGRDACFCVGGANGLSDAVKRRAELTLSLSALTLPHRLARLVLAEQLYRAFTILRGEPYHRA
ncbi:MAG: 23S rRNA (pseudouridine(1915)-N(3))-methyltransferase RlmH [Myxococcales bacterium]|jgi:23S rRNA (pseudouridine1915-N3)-methyltransferase|nr:23S rRNA (pseudouridine(1915)-N(3))-methyltransferase RlmH [Myxococcales bacterium]